MSVERIPVALSIDAVAQQSARRDRAPAGTVIAVDREIAGRTRGGVEWTADDAVATAAIARPAALDPESAELAWLAAGLAAADAMAELAGVTADCWWPDRLDIVGRPDLHVVTGAITLLGPGRVDVAILLARVGDAPAAGGREAVVAALASSLGAATSWLDAPGALVERYRRRCVTLDRDVRVRLLPSGTLHGRAIDVRETGALVVESSTGLRESTSVASTWTVTAGES